MTGSDERGAAVARGFGAVVFVATGAFVAAVVGLAVARLRVTVAFLRVAVGAGLALTTTAGALVTRGGTGATGA